MPPGLVDLQFIATLKSCPIRTVEGRLPDRREPRFQQHLSGILVVILMALVQFHKSPGPWNL